MAAKAIGFRGRGKSEVLEHPLTRTRKSAVNAGGVSMSVPPVSFDAPTPLQNKRSVAVVRISVRPASKGDVSRHDVLHGPLRGL